MWLQGLSRKAILTQLHTCMTVRGRKCFSAAGARTDGPIAMPLAPADAALSARSFDVRHAAAASAARQIRTIKARFRFSIGGGFQKLLFFALRTNGQSQALAKIILDASRRARFAATLLSLFERGIRTGKKIRLMSAQTAQCPANGSFSPSHGRTNRAIFVRFALLAASLRALRDDALYKDYALLVTEKGRLQA
jgi:hypothetical protein